MFTPPLSFHFAIALALCALPLSSAPAAVQGCPTNCPSTSASSQSGSSCAVVVSEVLSANNGSAGSTCLPSCSTCRSVVRFTWDLSGCGEEFVVAWTQQSYGTDGEALPLASGESNGGGNVRQSVTTPCSGSQARFELYAGALQQVFTLNCGCGV
ncbi:MAG: hypothetical protein HUU28_12035 [Planctomycetaceae bacterium]|jgi:hypothetical protein|nr:hypothetical protein [Planctomycetaceae bacterium]